MLPATPRNHYKSIGFVGTRRAFGISSKFKVQSSKFKVQSSKFKVQSSKFKVRALQNRRLLRTSFSKEGSLLCTSNFVPAEVRCRGLMGLYAPIRRSLYRVYQTGDLSYRCRTKKTYVEQFRHVVALLNVLQTKYREE